MIEELTKSGLYFGTTDHSIWATRGYLGLFDFGILMGHGGEVTLVTLT